MDKDTISDKEKEKIKVALFENEVVSDTDLKMTLTVRINNIKIDVFDDIMVKNEIMPEKNSKMAKISKKKRRNKKSKRNKSQDLKLGMHELFKLDQNAKRVNWHESDFKEHEEIPKVSAEISNRKNGVKQSDMGQKLISKNKIRRMSELQTQFDIDTNQIRVSWLTNLIKFMRERGTPIDVM